MNISLIIPCYNEVANIQKGVLDKIGNFTRDDVRFGEVIIVDDGSTDGSKNLIRSKYLPAFPKFRLVENKHLGKAHAIIRGIAESQGAWTMFSDIDLATPIEEAEKLIKAAKKDAAIVIGSRNSNREGAPITRKVMAVGMILVRNYLIGLRGVHDTQCGFKLFKTQEAREIVQRLRVFHTGTTKEGSSVSAGFDLEFLFIAKRLGYVIKEIPVIWRHVETKNVTFFSSSLESIRDILAIKWYELTNAYPR